MKAIAATKKTTPPRPPGIGASANLRIQLPLIGAAFPEIAAAHAGTINLQLDEGLLVLGFDHRTAPIRWTQDGSAPEVFDIVRVELEVRGKKNPAWLYIAHGSPHRADVRSHEVVAPTFIDIKDGERCVLHISRPVTSVPYLPVVFVL